MKSLSCALIVCRVNRGGEYPQLLRRDGLDQRDEVITSIPMLVVVGGDWSCDRSTIPTGLPKTIDSTTLRVFPALLEVPRMTTDCSGEKAIF